MKYLVHLILVYMSSFGVYSQNKIDTDSINKPFKSGTDIYEFSVYIKNFNDQQYRSLDSAHFFLSKAEKIAENLKSDSINARLFKSKSTYYLLANDYDSVFFYIKKVEPFISFLKPEELVDLYSTEGTTYYYQSDYAKAISSHLKAEEIANNYNDEKSLARVFNNIAISHIRLENWEAAEKFLNQSLDICEKHNLHRGKVFILGNLGIVYTNTQAFINAIDAYQQSNVISEELRDRNAIARNYDNIGALYERLNNYTLAKSYYQKSIDLSERIENKSTLANAQHNIASIYLKEENFNAAVTLFRKSLLLSESLGNKTLIKMNYKGLSEAFELQNDMTEALKMRKAFEIWKDSIINETHLKNISELSIKYETEKKEREILKLSEQKAVNDIELLKKETRIRHLYLVLFFGFIIVLFAFLTFKQRIKNKKQLEVIKAVTETQLLERKRISQDLHDSVGGLLAITKAKLKDLKNTSNHSDEELDKAVEAISSTAEEVRKISHNLMPGELVKFGLVSAIETHVDKLNKIGLQTRFYPNQGNLNLNEFQSLHLFRILQEITQNTLKHASATSLNIYLSKHDKYLNIMIEDDGLGFDPNTADGMGLKTIKSRVKLLQGTFNIDSSPNSGTTITIEIPIR
jgi:signal transduction histidine kinase